MMGRQTGDQSLLFYQFNLEERIPVGAICCAESQTRTAFQPGMAWSIDLRRCNPPWLYGVGGLPPL